MQAIHNLVGVDVRAALLFQRAKIQVKCKQFTTRGAFFAPPTALFQRAKIQVKCKQFTTCRRIRSGTPALFQRAKIQVKCKQFTTEPINRHRL